jgi:sirohydrochlorin cobaltochelatase
VSALVLFAHGARDPGWAAPFRDIQERVRNRQPGLAVEVAFLEIMQPDLRQAVTTLVNAGQRHIVIAPLFMAQGGHLKQDLPRLVDEVRGQHPGLVLELLPPVGEVENILEAISAWLVSAVTSNVGATK